jgi:hypothetical protein
MRFISTPQLACTLATCLIALGTVGCQQKAGDNAASGTAAAAPAGGGACRLLDTSEVSAAVSDAKRGEVDKSREQYGISACVWSTERGTFVAQYWTSAGVSAKNEASGLMLGVLDPLKGSARNNVRYEEIAGVGDQAVAVVESQDAQRGVLNDFAMLVAQRGDVILVLLAPELARSDRDRALASLKALAESAVKRL